VASIEELLRERLTARPDVELAVLFGSAARDELRPASDVDLGLRLHCKDRRARDELLADLERLLHRTLDVVDLDDAPPQLRFEIARDGKLVVERAAGDWSAFRARAFVDWWDFAPIARRVNEAAVSRLRESHGRRRRPPLAPHHGRLREEEDRLRSPAWLDSAATLLRRPLEDLRADAAGRDLAAFHFFLAAQESIDLAAQWVADAGWTPPDDVGSTFDVLAAHHAISQPLADEMRSVVRVRNRIAHGYASVDTDRFHAEAPAGIASVRALLAAVAAEVTE
jgi:uncharacterized protein